MNQREKKTDKKSQRYFNKFGRYHKKRYLLVSKPPRIEW